MKGSSIRLRSWQRTLSSPFKIENYSAMIRLIFRINPWHKLLLAYLKGKGNFPIEFQVRAFKSQAKITIHNPHDALTLMEVFCREDYKLKSGDLIFVDIGANIGIASTYFLMSSPEARVYAYEPNSTNIPKLMNNIVKFGNRIFLFDKALDIENGTRMFREESTGRYGGFSDISTRPMEIEYPVKCISINEEIARILEEEKVIHLLKIDVEGMEEQLINSITPSNYSSIRRVLYESNSNKAAVREFSYYKKFQ